MSNNLHAASSQWAKRPSDQRFWTLRDLRGACEASREGSGTATVPFSALKAANVGDDVLVTGPTGAPAKLTHYAFGQLATSIGAPASYLRELPPVLVADCLNVGINRSADKSPRDLLFHKNGGLTLRACLSNQYERVWDSEVVKYLENLNGWAPPAGLAPGGYRGETRLATERDILPGQINISVGESIAPSGLYASDHDMFAFLVAPDRIISDGAGGSLMRGMFVRNSEVGDSALTFTFFMMQAVCGNHIVWGASGVHEVRVRHVGKNPMRRALREFQAELLRYADGAAEEEKGIIAARRLVLGATKAEVLDALVKYAKTHSLPLSKARLSDAYDTAEQHTDWYGPPNTLWGTVAGLTQSSQAIQFADERAAVDRAAGRLMAMAF